MYLHLTYYNLYEYVNLIDVFKESGFQTPE
jgi:hypothetical protein